MRDKGLGGRQTGQGQRSKCLVGQQEIGQVDGNRFGLGLRSVHQDDRQRIVIRADRRIRGNVQLVAGVGLYACRFVIPAKEMDRLPHAGVPAPWGKKLHAMFHKLAHGRSVPYRYCVGIGDIHGGFRNGEAHAVAGSHVLVEPFPHLPKTSSICIELFHPPLTVFTPLASGKA